MNRDKIGSQTCYVHQHTFVGTLMYVACLCPYLVSVRFYAIPILYFKLHANKLTACTSVLEL